MKIKGMRGVVLTHFAVLTGLLMAPLDSFAGCTFVTPPTPVSTRVYVVGYAGGAHRLETTPLGTGFTFKCDADTAYSLSLGTAGLTMGVLELEDRNGVHVPMIPVLASVDGKGVNLPFKDLPSVGYAGHAVQGKVYQVTVSLLPASTQLPTGALSGMLTGNMQFSINY